MFGLVKRHKKGYPIRGIINGKQSPTVELEKWLFTKLRNVLGESIWNVKNSEVVFDDLEKATRPENFGIFTYDVTNMYPSIPVKEVNDLVLIENDKSEKEEKFERHFLKR